MGFHGILVLSFMEKRRLSAQLMLLLVSQLHHVYLLF